MCGRRTRSIDLAVPTLPSEEKLNNEVVVKPTLAVATVQLELGEGNHADMEM